MSLGLCPVDPPVDLWASRSLDFKSFAVPWKFQSEDEKWKAEADKIPCCSSVNEEEHHYYQKEKSPSGMNFFESTSNMIFDENESIDKKHERVFWHFKYGDSVFRQKALVPPCNPYHMQELEFHEYFKTDGDYEKAAAGAARPILVPIDCNCPDKYDPFVPPVRLCPPCIPGLPELPPPTCKVKYPNKVGEKEWHTVNVKNGVDENELSLYERNVKTCNPRILPQVGCGRVYELPGTQMLPSIMDDYSVDDGDMPKPADLPGAFNYSENEGECNIRETRGPGVYPELGYLPDEPLGQPLCVPLGYHYAEKQTHRYCKSGGEKKKFESDEPFPPVPDPLEPPLSPYIPCVPLRARPASTLSGLRVPCGPSPYAPMGAYVPTGVCPPPYSPCGPPPTVQPYGPWGTYGPFTGAAAGPMLGSYGPCGPCGPASPSVPCHPGAVCAQFGPCPPNAPCLPCGPCGPCGPCCPYRLQDPSGPCGPHSPCGFARSWANPKTPFMP